MTQLLWNIRNEFSQTLERWWWHLFWLQILISLPIWAKWPFFWKLFFTPMAFLEYDILFRDKLRPYLKFIQIWNLYRYIIIQSLLNNIHLGTCVPWTNCTKIKLKSHIQQRVQVLKMVSYPHAVHALNLDNCKTENEKSMLNTFQILQYHINKTENEKTMLNTFLIPQYHINWTCIRWRDNQWSVLSCIIPSINLKTLWPNCWTLLTYCWSGEGQDIRHSLPKP